jgi:hypothetical protein
MRGGKRDRRVWKGRGNGEGASIERSGIEREPGIGYKQVQRGAGIERNRYRVAPGQEYGTRVKKDREI